jgi:hypothetical protein
MGIEPADVDCPLQINNVMLGLSPVTPSYAGSSTLSSVTSFGSKSLATPLSHMAVSGNVFSSSAVVA